MEGLNHRPCIFYPEKHLFNWPICIKIRVLNPYINCRDIYEICTAACPYGL